MDITCLFFLGHAVSQAEDSFLDNVGGDGRLSPCAVHTARLLLGCWGQDVKDHESPKRIRLTPIPIKIDAAGREMDRHERPRDHEQNATGRVPHVCRPLR